MDKKNYSIKASPQSNRIIKFIISDETVDRDGEILVATGCDFSEYKANPQFLGFHSYHDYPLGVPKAWGIDSRARKVWMDVYFPTVEELATNPATASEKAKLVDFTYNAYITGLLNAVSVGFMTLDYEPIEGGRKITKWKLLEVSAVPIPANPNAVAVVKSFLGGLEMEAKSGAKFSKETAAAHAEIVEKMCKAHDDYNKAMKECHKELKAFMKPAEDDDGDPGPNPGDDGKGLNFDLVRKHLGLSQDSK